MPFSEHFDHYLTHKGVVTNYGEVWGVATKQEGGGQVKFYPYKKRGGHKKFRRGQRAKF